MSDIGVGFVGAGQMARALARGLVASGLVRAAAVRAADPIPTAREQFARVVDGASIGESNLDAVRESQLIVLATKPQQFAAAAETLRGVDWRDKLVVSILAGVRLAELQSRLGTDRVARVMPNTPALVGCGASAWCRGPGVTSEDGELIRKLLMSVGIAIEVSESSLDAVTGLSGSGPAFVFLMIEALADGGVRMGLPRDIAAALAVETVRGAAQLVRETGEHPAVLRERVASPGGTTIAGLQTLEERAVRGAVMAAVESATRRSAELGAK